MSTMDLQPSGSELSGAGGVATCVRCGGVFESLAETLCPSCGYSNGMARPGAARRGGFRSLAGTWLPWRFWSGQRLEQPRRSPLGFTLTCIGAFALATVVVVAIDYLSYLKLALLPKHGITPAKVFGSHMGAGGGFLLLLAGLYLALPVLSFAALYLVGGIWPRAHVRAGHLWHLVSRSWAGGAAGIVILMLAIEVFNLYSALTRGRGTPAGYLFATNWELMVVVVGGLALMHWWFNVGYAGSRFLRFGRLNWMLAASQGVVFLVVLSIFVRHHFGYSFCLWALSASIGKLIY